MLTVPQRRENACKEHFSLWHHQLCQQQGEVIVRTQEQLHIAIDEIMGYGFEIVKGNRVFDVRTSVSQGQTSRYRTGELLDTSITRNHGRRVHISASGVAGRTSQCSCRRREGFTCLRVAALDLLAIPARECEQRSDRADEQHHEDAGHNSAVDCC